VRLPHPRFEATTDRPIDNALATTKRHARVTLARPPILVDLRAGQPLVNTSACSIRIDTASPEYHLLDSANASNPRAAVCVPIA
jgi:hypothetical protein